MNVCEALKQRISIRAFLDRRVPKEEIESILDIARWAPSGGNLQPWRVHIVMGESKDRLIHLAQRTIKDDPLTNDAEIDVYPPGLTDPWRTRRSKLAEDMYDLLRIPRTDRSKRIEHVMKNYEFFGAPVGLFFSIHRQFDKNQWAHLGMFMQSIALVAFERGLGTCMQEAWTRQARLVSSFLSLPETEQIYCGMALGYPDLDAPVNQLRSERAPVREFTTFV